jgi:hypothetical protein
VTLAWRAGVEHRQVDGSSGAVVAGGHTGRPAAAAAGANRHADDYLLTVVLFASSLLFAGISTKLSSSRQRDVLLGLGYLVFLAAVIWAATIPLNFSF